MNSQEAKRILALYRPASAETGDVEVAAALEQAERDPELRRWLEQSCAFHAAMREKFQQIPVPADLREAILAANRIVRPIWWQRPAWLAAAAAIALLLGLAALWLQPRPMDRFSDFRSRMVRTALRQYRMDIATNDLKAVRQFLNKRGAPSEFVVTNGLEKLSVTGGVCTHWRSNPVSMVCFDRGDKQMVFLFVLDRSAVKEPPPATAQLAKVNKLLTASWSDGDKAYLLAGPEDSTLLRR